MEPEAFYTEKITKLSGDLKTLQRRRSVLGVSRLGSILGIIIIFYFFSQMGWMYVILLTVSLLILFRWLILKDLANKAAIVHLRQLIVINKEEIKALKGEYFHFGDGTAYQPKDHYYANDIDVIGHASLYQFCNRTTSGMGGRQLASWLLETAGSSEIINRQKAVKELALKRNWAQELQATGRETQIKENTLVRLMKWMSDPDLFSGFTHWRWMRIVLPAIIVSITIAAILDWIPLNVLYVSLLLFAVLAYQLNKIIAPLHEQLSRMVDELETLTVSMELIEKEKFDSSLLKHLHLHFFSGNKPASGKVRQLKKILDRLDIRYNIVLSAPLNLLFLWNLQQVLSLEKWKKNHHTDIAAWFHALAKFEALNSFATISFNNPDWAIPVIAEHHFEMQATQVGHPLIHKDKRVSNDISIGESGELMIVTGSNMAGKSTYLRSIGVNVILAMSGAPVCATFFQVSHIQLLSSMRVADNLEESTSTFYAELKKLKTLIDKVNNKEKIFFLLDEILRGTNSLDRHTGSVALVKQLIRHNAVGIIATHDVALAEMQKEYPANILNYHFDAQVYNDELFFDYKLKPGISTSLNASILMKKIGIEL